jgi:uncharacterized RDD family membrane protein YckC
MENYAGFWKRLVAIIIDGLILGVAQVFVFVPILGALGFGLFDLTNYGLEIHRFKCID